VRPGASHAPLLQQRCCFARSKSGFAGVERDAQGVARALHCRRPDMPLQFGSWAPVCGSWLRTRDADRQPKPDRLVHLARVIDRLGYDILYVPEHYLNALHGPRRDVLDAWIVSAACVAATQRLRVVTAVQPGFKAPGVVAKMGATLAQFRANAFGLSLLAGWWQLEAENYGDVWLPHAERYRRAAEYLDVILGLWSAPELDYEGRYYSAKRAVLEPKPGPLPPVFIAGESNSAVELAARAGDYLFINGGDPDSIAALVRKAKGLARDRYGRQLRVALSAFGVVRPTEDDARRVVDGFHERADEQTIAYFARHMDGAVVAHNRPSQSRTLEANLGLDAGLVGAPATIQERLGLLEEVGVDAVFIKTEPALEEAERFAREVIAPYRASRGAQPNVGRNEESQQHVR
jgi:FMNH2-dependent dimethyl sulfone monooxygenase